jgi:hypothetical protein
VSDAEEDAVSAITPDELLRIVPRLARLREPTAWQRVRGIVGPSALEQSRPGRSEELTGLRPAREEDPWKIVVWSHWLTRRQRVVRDYREVVPVPGVALIDDRPGLLVPERTARFAGLLSFTALARALLVGEPARLLTSSGSHRHGFDGAERLRPLAEAVAASVAPGRSSRRDRGLVEVIRRMVEEEIPANSVALALLPADLRMVELRAACDALRGPHLRAVIYVPFDERELAEPGMTLRGVRSGRVYAPAADYRRDLARHLDRMLLVGDDAGVTVDPLAIGDPDRDVWEVLSRSWLPHWEKG